MNWEDAFDYCSRFGMNLATLDSFQEAVYFGKIVKEFTWIGLNDKKHEGEFVRVTDGKIVKWEDIPWRRYEPNNANDEDCVYSTLDDGFNDADCNTVLKFSCEKVEKKPFVEVTTQEPISTTLQFQDNTTSQDPMSKSQYFLN
jgi:Lectin C-type domain